MDAPARSTPPSIACDPQLTLTALRGLPLVEPGDDLVELLDAGLSSTGVQLRTCDVLVVTSKILSRAEGCFTDLAQVKASPRAQALAEELDKDPALVQVVLEDTERICRTAPGVLIVRHRLGFVSANAGVDSSNARPAAAPQQAGPWALRMPADPDGSAASIRAGLQARHGVPIGVVVSDSLGRPFRLGTVGAAIGSAGIPPLWDQRGDRDLQGRPLEHTQTALADQLAAAADLVAGQGAEGRAAVLVRGLHFSSSELGASALQRDPDQDLFL